MPLISETNCVSEASIREFISKFVPLDAGAVKMLDWRNFHEEVMRPDRFVLVLFSTKQGKLRS